MSIADRIEAYLQGWINGDSALLLAETADGYYFDDPNRGRIAKADFEAYVDEIKAEADGFRGDRMFDNFEDLSEIVTKEQYDGTVTVYFEAVLKSSSSTAADSTVGLFASGETSTPVASVSNSSQAASERTSSSAIRPSATAVAIRALARAP